MITMEVLNEVFGKNCVSIFQYLENKNRGGSNNSKGNNFENHFAIFKIAKSFNEYYGRDKLLFSSQAFCFVDDLILEQLDENSGWFYQIKDVANLKWTDGLNYSIEEDFIKQQTISEKQGINSHLGLVVSKESVFEYLNSTKPESVKNVQLISFKSANSINNLIRDNSMVREELIRMCAFSNPSEYVLETLATILLGSWDSTVKKRVSLKEIIDKCFSQNPHYIKGLDSKISTLLESLFNRIEGFSFNIEGGYIKWRFNSTDEGNIMHQIGSKEYIQWESDILNSSIVTFEDLEPFLT